MQNLYTDLKLKQTKAEEKTNILQKAEHVPLVRDTSPDENSARQSVTFPV